MILIIILHIFLKHKKNTRKTFITSLKNQCIIYKVTSIRLIKN